MGGGSAATTRPLRAGDPRQLGRYRLLGRLGEGGMGTVYLGQSPEQRLVAVKVIRPDLAEDGGFRRRFRSEVARAQQVPPFCTAEVLEADPDHEPPYLVVEYVDGPSLATVVAERGPLTAANLYGLAVGVAAALTAIHGAGVIHRDLKPSNVLLALGSPKVIDFGIARAIEATAGGQTQTGELIGTIAYMAPERFGPDGDKALTPAADVFSWAAVVAFAGTGNTPFRGDTAPLVALRIRGEPPDLAGLSGSLRALVEEALAKDPARRPTARELLNRLLSTGPAPAPGLAAALAQQPELLASVRRQPTPTGAPTEASIVGSGRWARIAAIATTVSVLVLTATVVGLVSGRIALPGFLASDQGRPADSSPSTAAPPTSAAPSPSPSATPSPDTPSPTPTPDSQTVVEDALAAPGSLWQDITDEGQQATCRLRGRLVVTRQSPGSFRCRGADATLTNFDLTVDVSVKAGSCAGIWFRFQDLKGHALRICQDRYELVTHGTPTSSTVTVLRTFPLGTPLPADTATRVGISASDGAFVFSRQDREVFRWLDTTFPQGRVVLGIFQAVAASAPYEVAFANIRITTPAT